jgi:hypothetical protein
MLPGESVRPSDEKILRGNAAQTVMGTWKVGLLDRFAGETPPTQSTLCEAGLR